MDQTSKDTLRFRLFLAGILALFLGNTEAFGGPVRSFPFWACSDGKGTVSLFWLPPDGRWPPGGYRLERIYRKRPFLLKKTLEAALDEKNLRALAEGDADEIRWLADKIRNDSLTDEERRHSISVMGINAAIDAAYGRALGVRYTDRVKGSGKYLYRLTALDSDGRPVDAMESNEVVASRRTPGPAQPMGLVASEQTGGVALTWSDPPASALSPVVAFRVERIAGRGKAEILTPAPLRLNRHMAPGRPDFHDADPPRERLVYRVRSIDIFGRMSAPTRVAISAKNILPAAGPVGVVSSAPKTAGRPGTPAFPEAEGAKVGKPARGERTASISSPAVPASESLPAQPAESAGEKSDIEPDLGARSPEVLEVREEAVSEPASSGVGSSSPAEPARPESFPNVQPGPEPTGIREDKDRPFAEGSAKTTMRTGPSPENTSATVARETVSLSPPTIVAAVALGDRVNITFRPGHPNDPVNEFVLYRSESPTGPGAAVGRPIPGDARRWEDPTVEAGRYYWYRLVAVDRSGKRSAPSKPKGVAVGSR